MYFHMKDLEKRLARLQLSQYYEIFVNEGFDTWEILSEITESDLNHLGVKLGHRRRIQRAIAGGKQHPADQPLLLESPGALRSLVSHQIDQTVHTDDIESSAATASVLSTKRRYRRRPKTDDNAPERPQSAYVLFSNRIRELLQTESLSFTQIAKEANDAKEKYYAQLARYKQTQEYNDYQKYLTEFQAANSARVKGKRARVSEISTSKSIGNGGRKRKDEAYYEALNPTVTDSLEAEHNRSRADTSTDHAGLLTESSESPRPISPAYANPARWKMFHNRTGSHAASQERVLIPTSMPHAYTTQNQYTIGPSSSRARQELSVHPTIEQKDNALAFDGPQSDCESASGVFDGRPLPIDPLASPRVLPPPEPYQNTSQAFLQDQSNIRHSTGIRRSE